MMELLVYLELLYKSSFTAFANDGQLYDNCSYLNILIVYLLSFNFVSFFTSPACIPEYV